MLKILNTILFVACENSDGFMGFYYSHDGGWANAGYTDERYKSKMECANTCMGRGGCVGFLTTSSEVCQYYSNKGALNDRNAYHDAEKKAYIKCSGTNV